MLNISGIDDSVLSKMVLSNPFLCLQQYHFEQYEKDLYLQKVLHLLQNKKYDFSPELVKHVVKYQNKIHNDIDYNGELLVEIYFHQYGDNEIYIVVLQEYVDYDNISTSQNMIKVKSIIFDDELTAKKLLDELRPMLPNSFYIG